VAVGAERSAESGEKNWDMGDVKKGSSVGPASASASAHGMFVVKRDGRTEKVHFDKITSRIKKLCYGLNDSFVDPTIVAQKVCMGVYKGVTTAELDELAAETAAHLTSEHADYGVLAARIAVSNLHKQTKKSFTDTVVDLRSYIEPKTKLEAPLIDEKVYAFIMANASAFNSAIIYDRDYSYDYFGFKTLERSYLLKINGRIVERPQHMLMRVSVGIHCGDLEAALETYNYMSSGWFTHASPTLFNGGTPLPQLSSCFLLTMKDDSIAGIYDTLKQCAMISKTAGGIGLACHNIRATGSYIRGTNGISNGLVPMLRVFNATARYVDQGKSYTKNTHTKTHTHTHFTCLREQTNSFCGSIKLLRWRQKERRLCGVSGTLACGYRDVARSQEEPWRRRDSCTRPFLRFVDSRSLYETCRSERFMVAFLSPRSARPTRLFRRRV
jgi:hypothetical protein